MKIFGNPSILSVFYRISHHLSALAKKQHKLPIYLIATAGAAPTATAARVIAGSAVTKTVLETANFTFADIKSYRHPDFIPGAVKYGDLGGLLDLCPKDSTRSVQAFSDTNLKWLQ